jgi:hypothetical protein
VGRRIEDPLQAVRSVQRAGAIEAVRIANLLRDLDLPLAADFLADERHRE